MTAIIMNDCNYYECLKMALNIVEGVHNPKYTGLQLQISLLKDRIWKTVVLSPSTNRLIVCADFT